MEPEDVKRAVEQALRKRLNEMKTEREERMRRLTSNDPKHGRCDFCGTGAALRFFVGPGACICSECVELCAKILKEENLWRRV
jgi:hypothetical protein